MNRWFKIGLFYSNYPSKLKKSKAKFRILNIFKLAFTQKYLIYTNITLASCLASIGDVIEQKYETTMEIDKDFDVNRTKNMAIVGATMGSVSHFWYILLDKIFPGNALKIIIFKIIFDQFFGIPLDMTVFFGTYALLNHMNLEEFKNYVELRMWPLYFAEITIWPSAQFINFYFLPRKYRVLYDNTICLGYDVFMSRLANKKPKENLQ
ncbi:mpv17-like protein 2 [Onthophagus taurus]|uniref:mpv17-like protein 2 n=1 Tax=Onthophagus taurus TaxID=166361 RepID=UPI0039BE8D5A